MHKPKSADSRNVEQYRELHASDKNYGKSSRKIVDLILASIKALRREQPDVSIKSVLDFGCGKSGTALFIGNALNVVGYEYDPAIPEKDTLPAQKADIVINTDVLEHLDRSEIDEVLSDIRAISDRAFFQIATAPAGKELPSGENAHATVEPPEWWQEKIAEHFDCVTRLPAEKNRVAFVTWPLTDKSLTRITSKYEFKRKRFRAAVAAYFGKI